MKLNFILDGSVFLQIKQIEALFLLSYLKPMNSKAFEESKRLMVLGSQKKWEMILSAISCAEKNIPPESRKPQFQMAQKAGSHLFTQYFHQL